MMAEGKHHVGNGKKTLTAKQLAQAQKMFDDGFGPTVVAERFLISVSYLYRHLSVPRKRGKGKANGKI
jgi:hypothetical protein